MQIHYAMTLLSHPGSWHLLNESVKSTGCSRKKIVVFFFLLFHDTIFFFLLIYFPHNCVGMSLQLSSNMSFFMSLVSEMSQIFQSPFLIPRRSGKAISKVFGNCKMRTHCSTAAAHVHLCSIEHAEFFRVSALVFTFR